MPVDPTTGGNIGCNNMSTCFVSYYFDNTSGLHRSAPFSITQAFSGSEFEVPFSGTATSISDNSGTRTGNFSWSGTMRLKAVP